MTGPIPDAPAEQGPKASPWTGLVLRWRQLSARWRVGPLLLIGGLALMVGLLIGRVGAPDEDVAAAQAVDRSVVPLVLDADGIWTSASGDRPPVAEALVALRRDDDPAVVRNWEEEWLASYDGVLLQLAGLDMPAIARPVQRQFITAVTMSRDAVDVLGHAAIVQEPDARQDLLTEVARLRQRSEQLTASARASTLDLEGQRADVSPLPRLTSFLEGRRG